MMVAYDKRKREDHEMPPHGPMYYVQSSRETHDPFILTCLSFKNRPMNNTMYLEYTHTYRRTDVQTLLEYRILSILINSCT